MSRENLQGLLKRLGRQVQQTDLALDEDGYCLVQIDGKISLSIEFDEDSQSAILTAGCGQLPEKNRVKILQELLDANYYGAGSGGGTFSTNSRAGTIQLQYREPTAQLDEKRLKELLQALVNNAEFWLDRLEKSEPSAEGKTIDNGPDLRQSGGLLA